MTCPSVRSACVHHRFRALALGAALCLLALALARPARADAGPTDEGPGKPARPAPIEPAPKPTVEPAIEPVPAPAVAPAPLPPAPAPAAPPAADRIPYRRGVSRITLFGGAFKGGVARDAGILAAPITGQPGTSNYPAESPLRVNLDNSAIFGARYAWFLDNHWGIEGAYSHVNGKFIDPDGFDETAIRAKLNQTILLDAEKDLLVQRLRAHSGPFDAKVGFLDLGAVYVFNPKSKWPFEAAAGLGWASSSISGSLGNTVVFERLVTSDAVTPGAVIAIANELQPDPFVERGCLADNDPCIEMKSASGLTWHLGAGVEYAFTPHVHLAVGSRLHFLSHVLDPGDQFVVVEGTFGVSFLLGGK